MKKVLAALTAAALLTLPMNASAATDVKITATIEPAGSFALNFDAFQFYAKVGNSDNYAYPMKDGTEVYTDAPNYKVSTNQYYEVLVSGTDLVTKPTDGSEPLRLSSKRLEIQSGSATPIKLTSTPTQLAYGYGVKNDEIHYVNLNLNLVNDYYEYGEDMLHAIQSETNFEATVTFSFTSM